MNDDSSDWHVMDEHSNFIFTSGDAQPIPTDPDGRRFTTHEQVNLLYPTQENHMQAHPFALARMMAAAIGAILSSGLSGVFQTAQINALGPYRSRGHGKGSMTKSYRMGNAKRPKGNGGNGQQEMLRRRLRDFKGDKAECVSWWNANSDHVKRHAA